MLSNSVAKNRIGIAGYMGAGKSTCAGLLAGLLAGGKTPVRVIDADLEAKLMMNGDESIKRRLAAAFGASVVDENSIVFDALGKAAFASVKAMRMLNSIVHPALVGRLHSLVNACQGPCILDAALIPMWGIDSWFDLCLWVTAAPSVRKQRIMTKTGLAPEQIALRMSVQETLVRVPDGPPWTMVGNEGPLDDLGRRIAAFRHLQGEQREIRFPA
jgi:dephospho-CoA kinase